MNNQINVMIVDDHALMREGLARILEMEDNISIIDTACNGAEAITKITENKDIDVVLMDINMPNMNGIEALRIIKDMNPAIKIIILTVYDGREYLIETLNLGANGYMLKDADSNSLVNAIISVYNGGSYVHPSLAGELFKEINRKRVNEDEDEKDDLESLTKREHEILSLIAEGMSNRDISENLVISEKTVKNHVSSILRKLDLSDRTQAAIYAFRNSLKKL